MIDTGAGVSPPHQFMGNGAEYSLDIGTRLGAALQRAEIPVGIGQLLDLPENRSALLCFVFVAGIVLLFDHILLVPDEHYRHSFLQFSQQVILNLSHPEVDVVQRLVRSDVVHYDDCLRVGVEAVGDGLEAFLPCTRQLGDTITISTMSHNDGLSPIP